MGERDESGRFVKGHKGLGGRPKGIDFRKVCEDYAAKENYSLPEAIWRMTKKQIEEAENGNTIAYKAVTERFCGPVRQELDVTSEQSTTVRVDQNVRDGLRAFLQESGSMEAVLAREAALNGEDSEN